MPRTYSSFEMKKRDEIIYKVVTGLFSIMLLAGAVTYFAMYEMTSEMFTSLGVPTQIIYPLAIAKILGVSAIWFVKNPLIKNLAYLGFAIDFLFAIIAHISAGDGGASGPLMALALLIISFIYKIKIERQEAI